MPIVDYVARAKKDEAWFFALPTISEKNKVVIRQFIKAYNVEPATKSKFFRHIRFLLERIDIENELSNRNLITSVFAEIRDTVSPGYLNTIINVSKRLATWLNDDELPKSFKDVKKMTRKKEMRDLKPEDMWTWEAGKNVASMMTSIQMKAMLLTQLDAGFRPSEFVDLNYGDVIVKKDIVIFQVRDGKTGKRSVPCQRCAPYFLRWYEQHPTKQPTDPLWIMEFNDKSHPKDKTKKLYTFQRYRYRAIVERLQDYAEKASMEMPCDFYALRHSSCALDKLDNVPLDVAAARHGHSVEYFTEVYGRLDMDDLANRMRLHYGGKVEKRKIEKNIICERCDFPNLENARRCDKCGCALSLKIALEMEKENSNIYMDLKQEMEEMKKLISKQTFQEVIEKTP